jgi:hypothetical protein
VSLSMAVSPVVTPLRRLSNPVRARRVNPEAGVATLFCAQGSQSVFRQNCYRPFACTKMSPSLRSVTPLRGAFPTTHTSIADKPSLRLSHHLLASRET